MKNSTLLFRSLAVIILLSGSAHLIKMGYNNTTGQTNYNVVKNPIKTSNATIEENTLKESASEDIITNNSNSKKDNDYNENIDYIIGKWIVNYKSDQFNGAIVYNLQKENGAFNAYMLEYQDMKGNSQEADGKKVLTIKKFDGYKGGGIYEIEYEGEKHKVDCNIDMVDENTFKLSYDYYGYGDIETWKRK